MKKRALCALVSLALCVTLAGQAAAAESSVSFVVNGITLAADVPNRVEARTTYVSYWPIVSALYPNATAEWVNGQAEVKADGLTLHIKPGAQYIEANGRYLYVPDGVKCEGYSIMVPIRTLCQALGAGVEWDGTQSTIQITSGSGPILSGEQAYQADVVYWLSRIIYAESGNQPLDGKIAVGNVVIKPNEPVNSTFNMAIMVCFCIVPILGHIATIIAMRWYNLDKVKMAEIQEELENRKEVLAGKGIRPDGAEEAAAGAV